MAIAPQSIGVLALAIVLLSLGFLVTARDPHARVNRLFGLSMIMITGWIGSISLSLTRTDDSTVLFGRLAFAFASAIPFCLLWMFEAFPGDAPGERQRTLIIAAIFCVAFIAFSLSPWIVAGAGSSHIAKRSNFVYGPLHPFFGLYFMSCFGFALYRLSRKLGAAVGIRKLQLRYLLLGILLGGAGAITTNLVIPLVSKTSQYSLLGPYFSLVVAGFAAHAIVRHRLMDIRVVIRKGAVYFSALAVSAGVVVAIAVALRSATGFDGDHIHITAAVLIAIVTAIFFQPLKTFLQRSLNRYLYRQTYDYQQIVKEASHRLSTLLDLESLLTYLNRTIENTMKVEVVCLYLFDDLTDTFRGKAFGSGPASIGSVPDLTRHSSLPAFFQRSQNTILVREEIRSDSDSHTIAAATHLEQLGGDIAFPLAQDHVLSGFLVLGRKLSGDPFFVEDIDLLSTLLSQAAVAMKNAQLYRQVRLVNEYIENILATMESGVIAVSADGTVTLFNDAAERMTRLAASRIRGRLVQELPPALADALKTTTSDSRSRTHIETTIHDDAGRLVPIICSTTPLRDRTGATLGAVAVFSDLTELKELEEEKRRAERLASVGALASGIAHEIKNPLVAIKTFAELLPERFTDEDFRGDFAKVVGREIERIDDLVARLRDLATQPVKRFIPLGIREPITETLALLRGQLEQQVITVRSYYEDHLPLVAGDPAQLKQLFLNIFMNALEASEIGGTLTVRVVTRESFGGKTLVVEISDAGAGIPDGVFSKIFDPFFTTKKRGSGLGLSICRGIADAHRASIHAKKNSNRGTTIVVEFPTAALEEGSDAVVSDVVVSGPNSHKQPHG